MLAALVPLIPIVVAVVLSAGAAATRGQGQRADQFTPVAEPDAHRARPPAAGAVVALVRRNTNMRSRPGGRPYAGVGARTEFGSPNAMWVIKRAGAWLGVISPLAGNGNVGWIPAADVSLSHVRWQLRVSLSARRLTVLLGGRTLQRYRLAIGAPASPTPTGRFAVTDRLHTGNPAGPYGCCILALSADAPHAIQGWTGGNRIAIHSTPETASIGQAVSHGCLRLTLAEGRWLLRHVPLGTPTLIRS